MPAMTDEVHRELIAQAAAARHYALAPYSRFKVGAALECADGRIFTGCNIENASYGLTMCAERVALYKALSEGSRDFKRIAVVSAAATPSAPCGACRQLLWEYCGNINVILSSVAGDTTLLTIQQLLPLPFDNHDLC
jgi:cytidine deaminase